MTLPPWRRRLFSSRSRPGLLEYRIADARWTPPPLRIAVISDLHVGAPWTTLRDVEAITRAVNGLAPDLTVIAGDILADRNLPCRRASAVQIAQALAPLRAGQGVYAVLGNHDCLDADAPPGAAVRHAFAATSIRLLENAAAPLPGGGWIVGLASQRRPPGRPRAPCDPEAAFAAVPAGAPAILLAHEPDYFAAGDTRALLQISGHTHGGQANLFGWRPLTPSRFGGRYAWGQLTEGGRHLVVSGGVGFTGVPLRLLQPPEITLVTLSGQG